MVNGKRIGVHSARTKLLLDNRYHQSFLSFELDESIKKGQFILLVSGVILLFLLFPGLSLPTLPP